MKLVSFAQGGRDYIGFALGDSVLVDLATAFEVAAKATGSAMPAAPADMIALIAQGEEMLAAVRAAHDHVAANCNAVEGIDPRSVTWYPPVRRPSKICCVALNNAALDQVKISAPDHPAFFIKPFTALVGHEQPIVLRKEYGITHPEPELAVVIGRPTKDVGVAEAREAIFGYSVHNDITSVGMRNEDSFHFRFGRPKKDGTFEMVEGHTSYAGRYKGSDTFAALGPWIVTQDEIADPHDLDVTCEIVAERFSEDNTRNLTHSVPEVIAFISRFQTLLLGDVISMGTALNPQGETGRPLTMGDLNRLGGPVSVTIDGIGTLSNPVARD